MIAYTGIETISNMSEEARDAARTVPQGVILVVITVLALYAFIPIVALSAMPVEQMADGSFVTELGTTYADDPILGIVDNLGVSGGLADALRIYVGVLAAVILLIATNAGMIGVSRLSYSMGQYRQLPEVIRRVHPRYRTPYVAIIFFAVAAIVTLLPGKAEFLATLYSFGAMLSFTIAHAAVIRLRQTEPDAEREWMPPLNFRFRGRVLPLTALIGGLGTFSAWLVVMALNPVTLAVGLSWMAAGIIVYLLYRRYQHLPLRESVRIVMPEPLGVEEIEYRSVVVGLRSGEGLSDELVATALALTSQTRRAIHVVALVTVAADLPLDADLPEAEGHAQGEIERGRIEAGLRVTGQVERVRPGEEGYSLDRLARSLQAEAVIISLPSNQGRPVYDKVLRTLLARRPCRVIVVSGQAAVAS
jgi:APA family basic amino acid/polyamine antiporter